MPGEKEFNTFYEKELESLLVPLEAERKKIKKQGVTGFIFLGVAAVFFIFAVTETGTPAVVAAVAAFVTAIVFFVLFGLRKNKFTRNFKGIIVNRVIQFIDPSLKYNPRLSISKEDYMSSGLFVERPDRYTGDDYIEGMHGKTVFCFSELHTERQVNTDKSSHWETIFKGLFFIADFNKHFSGRTYVWREGRPQVNFLTRIFSSFASGLEKVKLESVEFEKRFTVYSSDQVEARYILTPSFMERVVRLQDRMGEEVSLSFVNTNIYVAIPIREALFEPSVFSANDFSRVEDFRTTLQIVYDIIDELKLNQRLWTKE
ncbi:MAG: DUF3137 domain-containing protein [Sphingobacteriales bacterium]|nr:DUF3137 domain-containing protein [Sphingobacteriales bacterium]